MDFYLQIKVFSSLCFLRMWYTYVLGKQSVVVDWILWWSSKTGCGFGIKGSQGVCSWSKVLHRAIVLGRHIRSPTLQ